MERMLKYPWVALSPLPITVDPGPEEWALPDQKINKNDICIWQIVITFFSLIEIKAWPKHKLLFGFLWDSQEYEIIIPTISNTKGCKDRCIVSCFMRLLAGFSSLQAAGRSLSLLCHECLSEFSSQHGSWLPSQWEYVQEWSHRLLIM